jgi:hypothetical protein
VGPNLGDGFQVYGPLTVVNSTISGNKGAGVILAGGAHLKLNNVTISGNVGGVVVTDGTVSMSNTIIAGNVSSVPGPDCRGTIVSNLYNLVGDTTGCTVTLPGGGPDATTITGKDPHLGPLADNGGPTETQALLAGSVAINAGNPAVPGSGSGACEATDQRGTVRSQTAGRCDIGAYEYVPSPGCGNGIVDGGEQCDDGAAVNGTAASCCTSTCNFQPPAMPCTGGSCNAAGVCVPVVPSVCGNGIVEGGEQCDPGVDPCCSSSCTIEGSSTVCRSYNNVCVNDDHCDGNAPICRTGGFASPQTLCFTPQDQCTLEDHCDGAGTCIPGKRFCNATFRALKKAYGVTCQSDQGGSCTIELSIPAGATSQSADRGIAARAHAKPCPPLPPPGASANGLVQGAGRALHLQPAGHSAALGFARMAKLRLSPYGLRLLRCNNIQLDGRTTISRGGKQFTIEELLPLLKQLRHKR